MLTPTDYSKDAIYNKVTRELMPKIVFLHGGEKYDSKYPEGIPSSIEIQSTDAKKHDSGFIMFPGGHARNTDTDLKDVLAHKFKLLSQTTLDDGEFPKLLSKLENIESATNQDLHSIYECSIKYHAKSVDE